VDTLLTQREAARIFGISERTLERHRTAGTGPLFVRIGRLVRYREQDLQDWIGRSVRSSTSTSSPSRVDESSPRAAQRG
jgi:excisionase family DNA binding protein